MAMKCARLRARYGREPASERWYRSQRGGGVRQWIPLSNSLCSKGLLEPGWGTAGYLEFLLSCGSSDRSITQNQIEMIHQHRHMFVQDFVHKCQSNAVWALVKSGSADVRICGCCVRIRAGISVRVRDGVRISNRVRRMVKLVNYSLITALPIATSADPLFTHGHAVYSWRYGNRQCSRTVLTVQ